MAQALSKNVFAMAKDDFLQREDLLKVIRKYKRSKDEVERDTLRDLVVKNMMRLVIKISQGYALRQNANPDDLFQNGVIGVIVALDKFKPNRGIAFSTYAVYWIENFVRRGINESKLINTHRYLQAAGSKGKTQTYFRCLEEARGDIDKFIILLRSHKISASDQSKIEHVISITQETAYIDIHGTAGGGAKGSNNEIRVIDIIEDKSNVSPDVAALDNIMKDKIMSAIKQVLNEIEQKVILGLYFSDKRKVTDVCAIIKRTKTSVNNIERRALKKLGVALTRDKKFAVVALVREWAQTAEKRAVEKD